MAPYREISGIEALEAPTRAGLLRLEVAPRHVTLEIPERLSLSVHDNFLTSVSLEPERASRLPWRRGDKKPRKPTKRSVRLDEGRLLVGRAHLTEDLSLWFEERRGIYRRILGIEPVVLLDASALEAWRALDALGRRLREALARHAGEAVLTTEFGRGQHRVLLVDYRDSCEVIARPVFRERHRPVFRVGHDGRVENLKRRGQSGRCVSRYSVTVGGDRIRFDQPDGSRAAELHLPWISPQDRAELALRFQTVVERAGRALEDEATEAADAPGTGTESRGADSEGSAAVDDDGASWFATPGA